MKSKPTIAITQGDPAGIGPEICLKTIMNHAVLETCRPVLIGDMTVLHQAARQLGLMEILSSTRCIASMEGMDLGTGEDPVLIDCGRIRGEVRPAVPTRESGTACLTYIETAVRAALDGNLDGIATAPITRSHSAEGNRGRRAVTSTKVTKGAGSSSVFRNASSASSFIASAGSTMNTRRRPS